VSLIVSGIKLRLSLATAIGSAEKRGVLIRIFFMAVIPTEEVSRYSLKSLWE
jgi:hypothetical protein